VGRLFGTDGVRGRANADLTPELALAVARAAASVLADRDGTSRPVAVVGRDPRASGEMLEAAVVAGLASAGAEVLRAGVLPTPAIAHLTGRTEADLGVMISASHNPMPDNGIKLFSRGGHKLPDAVEAAIEQRIAGREGIDHRPTGAAIGRVRDLDGAAEDYTAHVLSALREPLRGLVDGLPTAPVERPFRGFGTELFAVIPPFTLVSAGRRGGRALAVNLLAAGVLTAQVAARLPLTSAAEAMQLAESHTVRGKVVLVP